MILRNLDSKTDNSLRHIYNCHSLILRKSGTRRACQLFILLLFFTSIIMMSTFSSKISHIDYFQAVFESDGKINTAGDPFSKCSLPKYNPWNYKILQFFDPGYDYYEGCNKNFEIVTKLEDSRILVSDPTLTCWARCIAWISDSNVDWRPWQPVGELMECDIILAQCQNSENITVYEMVHAQVYQKKEVHSTETLLPDFFYNKSQKYDVHVLIIDSTGMGQGERGLPHTLNYLRNSMEAVTFPYYNKIGANSRPNGLPLLLGLRIMGVDRSWLGAGEPSLDPDENPCYEYVDNTNHLFKAFRKEGYKTMYAENWYVGIAEYGECKGFKDKPADHIMNNFYNIIDRAAPPLNESTWPGNCFDSYQHLIDYMGEFVEAYKNTPKFSFVWDTSLGHWEESGVVAADTKTARFIMKHREKLDDAFFIITSDHGLRFGEAAATKSGNYENNNPMFTISVPRALRQNKEFMENLRTNAGKLQTAWDFRATLFDIMEMNKSEPIEVEPKAKFEKGDGSSMLMRQNEDRNCRNMPIPLAFCLCEFERQIVDSNSQQAIDIGKAAVDQINDQLEFLNISSICHNWEFKKVESIESIVGTSAYFLVFSTTDEHPAEFTMIMNPNDSSSFSSLPDRLDEYFGRGDCAPRYDSICDCRT